MLPLLLLLLLRCCCCCTRDMPEHNIRSRVIHGTL
jgi:hypothetical protein